MTSSALSLVSLEKSKQGSVKIPRGFGVRGHIRAPPLQKSPPAAKKKFQFNRFQTSFHGLFRPVSVNVSSPAWRSNFTSSPISDMEVGFAYWQVSTYLSPFNEQVPP